MTGKIPPPLPLSREELEGQGFNPVPRDDRLFDVFPQLTRDRGFELWEKWSDDEIELVAVKFQDPKVKPKHLKFPRQEIEARLLENSQITLE